MSRGSLIVKKRKMSRSNDAEDDRLSSASYTTTTNNDNAFTSSTSATPPNKRATPSSDAVATFVSTPSSTDDEEAAQQQQQQQYFPGTRSRLAAGLVAFAPSGATQATQFIASSSDDATVLRPTVISGLHSDTAASTWSNTSHQYSSDATSQGRISEHTSYSLADRHHLPTSSSSVGALLRRFSQQQALARSGLPLSSSSNRRQTEPYIFQSGPTAFAGDPTRLYHAPGYNERFSHATVNRNISSSSSFTAVPTNDFIDLGASLLARSPPTTFEAIPNNPAAALSMNHLNDAAHSLQHGASVSSSGGYTCPNCAKKFARDDLLRRHLAREARAAAQPSLDRQKSCFECARSKARCDLEVPSCGRCRARGKTCTYGARSGNPNVRRSGGRSTSQEMGVGMPGGGGGWAMGDSMGGGGNGMMGNDGAQHWQTAGLQMPSNPQGTAGMYTFPRNAGSGPEGYESDDSHTWSDSYGQHGFTHRADRTISTSSSNTNDSFDYQSDAAQQSPQTNSMGASGFASQGQTFGAVHQQRPDFLPSRSTTIDTSVQRARVEDDEATPVNRAGAMGPPLVTPIRSRETAGAAATSNAPSGSVWIGDGSLRTPLNTTSSRPQVPRLLTGARMPRPPEAGHPSARPLFSAQLDLSGWLEEPVIPSPLYRMGPSLSALGAAGQSFLLPTPTSTMLHPANAQLLSNLHAANSGTLASDTIMQQHTGQQEQGRAQTGDSASGVSQHAQVAARNWWAAGPQERSAIDAQEVAQACAGHFTLYPALMVLPDPTSPVPPLFHRPWLAFTRLQTPPALALVRVALAAYHVRLPASESVIWEMIRSQAKTIVASYDVLAQASDMEVFSSTAALWFLVILLLMSTDSTSGQGVDEGLTDSCLVGLSHLARLLQQRVQALEQQAHDNANAPPSFLDWGFLETMRRTLFACYTLFVLQRFRPTSAELQCRLAGAELVLDIKLPATASEFEAGDELEWRAAQHVKITDDQESALQGALTLRELLQARSNAQQEAQKRRRAAQTSRFASSTPSPAAAETNAGGGGSGTATTNEDAKNASPPQNGTGGDDNDDDVAVSPITEERRKQMLAYFDRHDDFTNVCLTVTFALDARI